jgi:26S proteasome regulatory subunit N3
MSSTKSKEPVSKDPKNDAPAEPEKEKTPEEIEALLVADLNKFIAQVKKTSTTNEVRYATRAIRHTFTRLRRKLTVSVLEKAINQNFPQGEQKSKLLKELGANPQGIDLEIPQSGNLEPEVDVYLHLLVGVFLLDSGKHEESAKLFTNLVSRMGAWNRRTLDSLSAKVYFYFARTHEKLGRITEIRNELLQLQRTAVLRHNFDGQLVLLNLLLRNYLAANLYDQAEKLASHTKFAEEKASTNEAARYHFYLGRINAVQLNYTSASTNLQKALRKGPRDTAPGFRSIVTKFYIIVQLLLGEIPERHIFRTAGITKSLVPYLELTQAVRSGSVGNFQQVLNDHAQVWKNDNTFLLVQRLRHNVIKTGLKKISLAYSCISFQDICKKLNLESAQDAEFIVAKAVSDGIIDATINHAGGFIKSNENVDIYATNEPEKAFDIRVNFCLQIHNDAVQAMRYPPDSWKQKTVEDNKTKDVSEETLADLLAEDDDDDE